MATPDPFLTEPAPPAHRSQMHRRGVVARGWWGTWVVAAAVAAITSTWPRLVQPLEGLAYDMLAPTMPAPTRAVIVEVDDASLAQLGRWPWSRSVHAALLDRLRAAGADRTAFALLFADAGDAAGDAAFEQALARTPGTVLGYTGATEDSPGVWPLPALARHAQGGRIDVVLDADGIVRRLGQPAADAPAQPGDRSLAEVMARTPLSTADAVLLPVGTSPMPRLSFADALRNPRLSQLVAGKAVFVGFAATGLGEPLPISRRWGRDTVSGVAFHARAFEALNQSVHVTALAADKQLRGTAQVLFSTLGVAWLLDRLRRRRAAQPGAHGSPPLSLFTMFAAAAVPMLTSGVLLALSAQWWSPVSATLALASALGLRRLRQLADARREALRTQRDNGAVLSAIGDAVVVVSADGLVQQANPSAQRLALRPSQLPPGQPGDEHLSPPADTQPLLDAFAFDTNSRQALADAMREVLQSSHQQSRTTTAAFRMSQPLIVRNQGDSRALQATLAPLRGTSGSGSEGLVIALTDVTEATRAARDLRYAAEHDALTGLPNRSVLPQHLAQALARRPTSASQVAVLFLDLDRFKRINDSLGHRRGDEVLRITADRLRRACDPGDTVARWGGDEFVLLLGPVASGDEAARRTARILEEVSVDIDLDGMAVSCAGSIGLALAPQDGDDLESLLALADKAMFRAKNGPGATWQRWVGDGRTGEGRNWARERLHLEAAMRLGLQSGEFRLCYQPQVSLTSGQLVGFEALLRWVRADGSVVSPATFIEVAEESRLILDLGEWALREAVRTLSLWHTTDGPTVPVSVNLSANQCRDPRLPGLLRDILASTALPPERLKLEITETAAMREPEQVRALLEEIHAMGLGLALDDFGTGYSSLAYLKKFPIDQIKIDRSFVHGVETDRDNGAIVRATVALAHSLGLPVVAEGVETPSQRLRLSQLRCDMAQGFLFAPALSADEAARWLVPSQAAGQGQRDLWEPSTPH